MPDEPTTPPTGKKKTGMHQELLGLPVWAWALGVGAFAVAVFVMFRQKGSASGTDNNAAATGLSAQPAGNAGVPVPYPFPVPSLTTNTSAVPPPPIDPATAQRNPYTSLADFTYAGITNQRPDIAKGIQEGRWNDIVGQYEKELVSQEQQGILTPSNQFGRAVNSGSVPAPVSG